MSTKEAAKQDFSRCLRQDGPHAITWLGQPETRFTFDHVAGENISQENLFKVVGLPIVENCMAGYNSCMFAYVQMNIHWKWEDTHYAWRHYWSCRST